MATEKFFSRRTESSDAGAIAGLLTRHTESLFGRLNAEHIIEHASFSVSLVSADSGEVVGHISLTDQPAGLSQAWDQWLQQDCHHPLANPVNTLFVCLFAAKESYHRGALTEILRTVFMTLPSLQYLFMKTHSDSPIGGVLSEHFSLVQEQGGLYITHRHSHFPVLAIRPATIEDSDDLLPILLAHSPHIQELYGEYFLPELIASQDEAHKTLVAEVNGHAVGLMSVTTLVDIEMLSSSYMLESYHQLRRPHPEDLVSTGDQTDKSQTSTDSVEKCVAEGKVYDLKGDSAALAVQLFAIDEQYEMRSVDFLPAVFTLFPQHEFLVLTQPHNTADYPLLAHFTAVPPRPDASLPQELYLTHKASLLHSFRVSAARADDMAGVKTLVDSLEAGNEMVDQLINCLETRRVGLAPLKGFIAKCADQIVGLAIIRLKEDIEYTRSHYNIEDFIYYNYHSPGEHAQLEHLVLSPVFTTYSKQFLKEVLRLSQSSCLYYQLPSCGSLISALHCLVPVRPRRAVVYPDNLGVNAPIPDLTTHQIPTALYHTNTKLTYEPKIPVNSRLVVVGGSSTALAMLETLVFCPHLQFNNITLISPQAMESWPRISLATWVHTVQGKLTAIDRASKTVSVVGSNGEERVVSYDWLVLSTGLQYTPPVISNSILTSTDNIDFQQDGGFLVYGSGLDSYTAVDTLLANGVAPDQITLASDGASCISDSVVEGIVSEALSDVRVLSGVRVSDWIESDGRLQAAVLTDQESQHTVNCSTVLYLADKAVDSQAFKAINDACLVFDKQLVIDTDHCTNDPLILAAGPLTKFSRKYRVGEFGHGDLSSEEVGVRLALSLLARLDPTTEHPPDNHHQLIPVYKQPVVERAIFPRGQHYLTIKAPPLAGANNTSTKGRVVSTQTASGYFKLSVSEYGSVDGLVVLSPQPLLESANYESLYGLHQGYLNNLLLRFDQGLITDLFCYLREPWACAVYNDRFTDFVQEVKEHLSQQPHQPDSNHSLEAVVRGLVDDGQTINSQQLFNNSPAKKIISERLHKFTHYNRALLPMFAQPDQL